jgi:hypothetical protein
MAREWIYRTDFNILAGPARAEKCHIPFRGGHNNGWDMRRKTPRVKSLVRANQWASFPEALTELLV